MAVGAAQGVFVWLSMAVYYYRLYTTGRLGSSRNIDPGWVRYLEEDVFYTNLSITASGFMLLL